MRLNREYLKYYFDFLRLMTEKEIRARYKRAVFSFLWIILNPLLQMVVIGGVFSFFIKIPNYFIFLFTGLLLWQFFSLSISKTTPSIVNERALLFKAKFPIEAIPLSIILSNFFNILISYLIFLPLIYLIIKFDLIEVLYLIISLVWVLVLTIFFSLITASLNVKYRDINFFMQTLLILWFYATPILYDLSLIPNNIVQLFYLNPLTTPLEILHLGFMNRGYLDSGIIISNLLITLLITLIGIWLWKKENKFYVDWL